MSKSIVQLTNCTPTTLCNSGTRWTSLDKDVEQSSACALREELLVQHVKLLIDSGATLGEELLHGARRPPVAFRQLSDVIARAHPAVAVVRPRVTAVQELLVELSGAELLAERLLRRLEQQGERLAQVLVRRQVRAAAGDEPLLPLEEVGREAGDVLVDEADEDGRHVARLGRRAVVGHPPHQTQTAHAPTQRNRLLGAGVRAHERLVGIGAEPPQERQDALLLRLTPRQQRQLVLLGGPAGRLDGVHVDEGHLERHLIDADEQSADLVTLAARLVALRQVLLLDVQRRVGVRLRHVQHAVLVLRVELGQADYELLLRLDVRQHLVDFLALQLQHLLEAVELRQILGRIAYRTLQILTQRRRNFLRHHHVVAIY